MPVLSLDQRSQSPAGQPAEIAKVAMIFWLAYSLSKKGEKIRSFSVGFLPHALMAGFLMLLCLKQPDFGSAVMIALWDVEPLPAKAATRLANVELVERPCRQRGHPRVRLLIQNPLAWAPLTERAGDAFRELL